MNLRLRVLLIIVVSVICVAGFAQKNQYLIDTLDYEALSGNDQMLVDSAMKLHSEASHDTSKLNALNILSEQMANDAWVDYTKLMRDIAKSRYTESDNQILKGRYKNFLGAAYNNLGYWYMSHSANDSALSYYNLALELHKNDEATKGIASLYTNIGLVLKNQGKIRDALEYYEKANKIQETLKDYKGLGWTFNNIGMIYRSQDEPEMALEFYQKALVAKKKGNITQGMGTLYSNMGMLQKDNDEALKYFFKALKSELGDEDKAGIGLAYNNIAQTYRAQGEIDSAFYYNTKALKIRREVGDKRGISYSLANLSESYQLLGKLDSAKILALEAMSLAQEIGYPDNIRFSADRLYHIYRSGKDWENAVKMHELYIRMDDSLSNISNKRLAIMQHAKYEYEKKKALGDLENEKKVAIERHEKERQKILAIVSIAGLVLVIGFAGFLFNRYKATQKQKQLIEEQKQVVEEQHHEIQSSIQYAKRIQTAILPPDSLIQSHLREYFVYYQPKDVVAGDFYWLEHHDGITFLAVADCTGHGVPGAMVSVVCHNALNRAVREFGLRNTGKILDKVRELVVGTFEKSEEQVKDGMDICLVGLNWAKGIIQFSGANNPLYVFEEGELNVIKGTRQAIGFVEKPRHFEVNEVLMDSTKRIYLSTDGYADQFGGPDGKKYTYKRFRADLEEIIALPMKEQHQSLIQKIKDWMVEGGEDQIDDICVIGLKPEKVNSGGIGN